MNAAVYAAMSALCGLPCDVQALARGLPFTHDSRLTVEQAARIVLAEWMANR